MGWFDESDDDDEKDDDHKTSSSSFHPRQHEIDNLDEEDPLDAYMKTLKDDASSSISTLQQAAAPRAEPLNLVNQEEATDHWREVTLIVPSSSSEEQRMKSSLTALQEQQDDSSSSATATTRAQQAMASMFHRAGERTRADPSDNNNHDEEDYCDSKTTRQPKASSTLSQTLETVQHDQMHYAVFRKCLWTTPPDTLRGHHWRQQHHVTCHPGTFDPVLDFASVSFIFGDELRKDIDKRGYASPTLVQSQTLPVALSGHDALITASTGSGKTLSYIWPMVVHVCDQPALLPNETGPVGLVLVPTRELAHQVHQQAKSMVQSQESFKSLCITGGTNRYQLVQQLKRSGGVDVVVATPGRLLDVLNVQKKSGMTLARVTFVVLDEADKMLDMGFEPQVTQILSNIRPDRQTLMLSATMGKKVERVARRWLNNENTVRIAVGRTGEASEHVQQHVMVLPSYAAKKQWMMEMVPVLAGVGKTLIFVATRADCETLADELRDKLSSSHLQVQTLHGDKHQSDRNAALRAFSKGQLGALIATDVAARGLDVKNVSTVVSFDPAKNLDAHTHRVGRAGRLTQEEQKEGVAYTLLLTPKHADFAHVLANAFEREGRQVTEELRELAGKSRQSGNVAKRTKWNKSGLGFHHQDPSSVEQPRSMQNVARSNDSGSYYGPASFATTQVPEPPTKRSRWGDRV